MAQKVQVILFDDLDGGEADETVSFSLDGVAYEIDLSSENAEKLRSDFERFTQVARRLGGRRSGVKGQPTKRTEVGPDTAEVKRWADGQGKEYPKRGRLPKSLIEEYERAH